MDEEIFNMTIRKFLKEVGVTAQREIETAVREALRGGRLQGTEKLGATMTLEIGSLRFTHVVNGQIDLA